VPRRATLRRRSSSPQGTPANEVTGASPRGTRECWTLRAGAGQLLSGAVESPSDNVVFQIYRLGCTHIGAALAGPRPARICSC
jgi:hypothetical protein